MAYNATLAGRIRQELANSAGYVEKAMFGGIGYMLDGNIACGIIGDDLVVRTGPKRYTEVLSRQNVRTFDYSGRSMKDWVYVTPEGYQTDADLSAWVQLGVAYALSLPPK